MPPSQSTADLIEHLCERYGRKTCAAACVKKIVQEQRLKVLADLRETPRQVLEEWGVPLKLVSAIYDQLADLEAAGITTDVSAFVNYTLRPGITQVTASFLDQVQKGIDQEEWATLRLQRAWRRRRRRIEEQRLEEKQRQLMPREVEAFLDKGDFKRLGEEENYQRRKQRAEDRIRRFIREKREHKARRSGRGGGGGTFGRSGAGKLQNSVSASMDLVAAILRDNGPPPDCELKHLLEQIAEGLPGTDSDDNAADVDADRLVKLVVICNWMEDIDDINLADEWHWKEWGVPREIVLRLKETADARAEAVLMERVSCCLKPVHWVREFIHG